MAGECSSVSGEEEERPKRHWGKNKVVAARCRNKKKERTEFLQRESEWQELMNAELKTQVEELKQERQQLILMLNRHHPTCVIRTDCVKTPTRKTTHCWSSWRRSDRGLGGGSGGGGGGEMNRGRRRTQKALPCCMKNSQ
ncbi:hypothetical protein QTO34_014299 [Cnephaeus nilssonii]|uniref:BZIP domain-containing protein n=1 Tax=Cnephaeus nilssonii TaxID=3371016 RepID=A0AA40I6Y0_CNENI|nr:hypothetical protein QTO34_014299 [Eptesicus nilssonii]